MRFALQDSPHIDPTDSVSWVMLRVVIACLPGVALLFLLFGWGIIIQILWVSFLAVLFEAAMLLLRQRSLRPLRDNSALVTAWLLAISLPPLLPAWISTIAVFSAIVIAKQLYGGLGFNPFNPAMVGYVMVLVAFPQALSQWPLPTTAGGEWVTLNGAINAIFFSQPDGITGATVLDVWRTATRSGPVSDALLSQLPFGVLGASGWEWVNLAFLAGGVWLVWTKAADWRIPLSILLTLLLLASVFHLLEPQRYPSALFHVFSGAAIFGAFFIATDPVSASTTPLGRVIFGIGVGTLIFVIRSYGSYPDAVAFAVLLMNITAPTLDIYAKPRVFGT